MEQVEPGVAGEENQDREHDETGEQAAAAGDRPDPDPFYLVDPPVGGAQPCGPSVPPNLSYGVLPNAASTPRGIFKTLQGGSGSHPMAYNFKPQISLERVCLPTFLVT